MAGCLNLVFLFRELHSVALCVVQFLLKVLLLADGLIQLVADFKQAASTLSDSSGDIS